MVKRPLLTRVRNFGAPNEKANYHLRRLVSKALRQPLTTDEEVLRKMIHRGIGDIQQKDAVSSPEEWMEQMPLILARISLVVRTHTPFITFWL